ncbi:MAG: hypothetical protein LUE16_10370 [Lachnospiraceae bacterium]|nr:hypothetical protein [Lachnospiraceae bacterium]
MLEGINLEGIFEIVRQNMLSSTGSGTFYLSLFLLPVMLRSRDMRYKFVYPVYTIFLIYTSYWIYTNIISAIMGYAPARFVTLIPIPFIIALVISDGCNSVKGKGTVLVVIAALFLFYFISDAEYEDYYDDDYKIENVYGLPQDVVDVCDLILSENEEPLLLVNDPDIDYFRQYSGKIKMINVNIGSMTDVAATRSEYSSIRSLMSDSEGIDMNLVGELAEECGVDYIVLNADAYHSVFYADELYYSLYEVIGDYLVFKVNS